MQSLILAGANYSNLIYRSVYCSFTFLQSLFETLYLPVQSLVTNCMDGNRKSVLGSAIIELYRQY